MNLVSATASPPAGTAAGPSSGEEARRKQEAERQRNAAQALQTLKGLKRDAVQTRKSAARARIERLKAILRQMQMFGATPQQIARLAKELASAVKAYGGSTDGDRTSAAPSAAEPSQVETQEPAAGAEGAVEPSPAPGRPSEAGSEETTGPVMAYERALQAQAKDADRRAAEATAERDNDREFIASARALARLLRQAAAEAARKAGRPDDAHVAASKAAVDAVETALKQAEGGALSAGAWSLIA